MAAGKNQSPKPFQLIAGDVALDLINTLDDRFSETGPEELLASYDDLLRFVTESGLLTERQARKLRSSEASQSERAPVLTQVQVMAQVQELPRGRRRSGIRAPRRQRNLQRKPRTARSALQASRIPSLSHHRTGPTRLELARSWPPGSRSLVAAGAVHRGSAAIGGRLAHPLLCQRYLPMALPRHQQKSHPPLVRHEGLRKPHESQEIPRPPDRVARAA